MNKLCTLLTALALSGCATGPNYYANPLPTPPATPAAIMSGRPCSAMAMDYSRPSANATTGWSSKLPAGMAPLDCGGTASKYGSGPFYCANPAGCPRELTWDTHPGQKDRGVVYHGLVDLLGGEVAVCADVANKIYVGSGECKDRKTYKADADHPVRIVAPVTVPPLAPGGGEQTATTVMISIKAVGAAPIYIGQVGWAGSASQ